MTAAVAAGVAWFFAAGAAWRAITSARRAVAARRRIVDADPPASVGTAVAGLAVATVVLLIAGPAPAIVLVAVGTAARTVHRRVVARTAAERDGDALADVVDAVARALRSGQPPTAAVTAASVGAPPVLRAGLAAVAHRATHGVPLAVALDDWAGESTADGAALVASAYAVTTTAGGDHGRALLTVADTLRERRALRRELRALSSQARLSAAVIAAAPLAFAAVAAAVDPATADVLLGSPLGLACVAVGIALDVAGWRWMERITRSPS